MNPNLIPQEQSLSIISLSKAENLLTGSYLGSIIQKHLTLKNLSNVVLDPKKDFFYLDGEEAINMFIKYCVQQEEIKDE